MADQKYLHGYTQEEQQRLRDQNDILAKFIYKHIDLTGLNNLLEVGCGVGAQLEYVMKHYPSLNVTGVDISDAQIQQASKILSQSQYQGRYQLYTGNIRNLTFDRSFDGLLLVWVLEHVADPKGLLYSSLNQLSTGGRFFLTEVNNQSLAITGVDSSVMEVWNAMDGYQTSLGGNGNIGAELDAMLADSSCVTEYKVNHRMLQWGNENRAQRNQMLNYWIGLMRSSAVTMIEAGFIKPSLWEAAQQTMLRACEKEDASFSYAFVQAFGEVIK